MNQQQELMRRQQEQQRPQQQRPQQQRQTERFMDNFWLKKFRGFWSRL